MSTIIYRLEDGSEWQGVLSYEEAAEGSPRALSWLAASRRAHMQDCDPSLWIEAFGPPYKPTGVLARTWLRPSSVISFHVFEQAGGGNEPL